MSTNVNVIEDDAIKVAEAIASAVAAGSGSATLDPIDAQVAGKTVSATVSIAVSKGSALPKGSALNDGIRIGEAFAQAFISGTGSATLDPFGVNLAGTDLIFATTVSVAAK